MKKSSGSTPAGSRTMTRRTRSSLLTAYQSTSRTKTSRSTVVPRMSTLTLRHWFGRAALASPGGVGSRSPLVRGRPRFAGAWWRGLVEGGVASDPGGQVGAGQVGAGQGRVGTVGAQVEAVSYTHLRAHETDSYLVCRLLLEKKK